MTQNIEQRTLAAVNQYENASGTIDKFAHADEVVNTPVGAVKTFPKISKEWDTHSTNLQEKWTGDAAALTADWKAERDALSIKALPVLAWAQGETETNLNQQRRFTDGHTYLPKSVPAAMGAEPDANWIAYTADKSDVLSDVFGSKPVDLVNNMTITAINNQYPKLAAFNAIYELADNSASYTVKSYTESADKYLITLTLIDDSEVFAVRVSTASKKWTQEEARILAKGGLVSRTLSQFFSDSVNVMTHGYIANNSTDTTAALQSAIDYAASSAHLNAKGVGHVIIPNTGDNAIIIGVTMRSNVIVTGLGQPKIKLKAEGAANWQMLFALRDNVSNSCIRGLYLDGSADVHGLHENQMHGIGVYGNCHNLMFTDNVIGNTGGDGIWIAHQTTIANHPTKVTISNSRFFDTYRQDIAVVTGDQITITGCNGNGNLDIESDNNSKYNTNIAVSGCVFDEIRISPRGTGSAEEPSNIAVSGCVSNGFYLWGNSNTSVSGCAIKETLLFAEGNSFTVTGCAIGRIASITSNGTFIKNLVISSNAIRYVNKDITIPAFSLNLGNVIEGSCLIASNNIVTDSNVAVDFPFIRDTKMVSNNIVSTHDQGIGVKFLSNTGLESVLLDNTITAKYRSISMDGATKAKSLTLKSNILDGTCRIVKCQEVKADNVSVSNGNFHLQYVDSAKITNQELVGDSELYLHTIQSLKIRGNVSVDSQKIGTLYNITSADINCTSDSDSLVAQGSTVITEGSKIIVSTKAYDMKVYRTNTWKEVTW